MNVTTGSPVSTTPTSIVAVQVILLFQHVHLYTLMYQLCPDDILTDDVLKNDVTMKKRECGS